MYVQLLSLVIALVAIGVAVWQVRTSSRAVLRANSVPVLQQAMSDVRSPTFRQHLRILRSHSTTLTPDASGFRELPDDVRESAYTVCYFYDYLGSLVAHRLVPGEIVIGMFSTQLVEVWQLMEPLVLAEREHRASTAGPYVSPGFLRYFEHLVTLVVDSGGKSAAQQIHKRRRLKALASPLNPARFDDSDPRRPAATEHARNDLDVR